MIQGQTNVRSSRFGAGACDGMGKELGRFIVTTMDVPWQRAQKRLGAAPAGVLFVENMEIQLEERLQRPFIHGWIVGLGVHLLSRLQENRHVEAVAFMETVGLPYQPVDLEIRREYLTASLLNLRSYVDGRQDLWHTIVQERVITVAWIEEALASLRFQVS